MLRLTLFFITEVIEKDSTSTCGRKFWILTFVYLITQIIHITEQLESHKTKQKLNSGN